MCWKADHPNPKPSTGEHLNKLLVWIVPTTEVSAPFSGSRGDPNTTILETRVS